MDELALTDALAERNLLDTARQPGTYALRLSVPDSVETVARTWMDTHPSALPEGTEERLAAASTVLYVGASGNVYDRLCDHVRAKGERVRSASFVAAFEVRDVVDVWPEPTTQDAFDAEYNRALSLADDDTRVWTDGTLL